MSLIEGIDMLARDQISRQNAFEQQVRSPFLGDPRARTISSQFKSSGSQKQERYRDQTNDMGSFEC